MEPDPYTQQTESSQSGKPQRLVGELRRRVLGWILLISLVPLVIMAVQGYHCAMMALVDRTGVHLETLLDERAHRIAEHFDAGNPDSTGEEELTRILEQWAAVHDTIRFSWKSAETPLTALDHDRPSQANPFAIVGYSNELGQSVIAGVKFFHFPGSKVGSILLTAETREATALAWLGRLRFRATVTGLITLVVLVVIALWISNRLGQPLAELARVANLIRHGNIDERLGTMPGAEAEEVRQAFNQMLDELQAHQKALVRNATLASIGELSSRVVHEIRNPLSSIKMNLQSLERHVREEPQFRELASIASEQVQRVESMLDDLLQYGKPVELDLRAMPFSDVSEMALAVVRDQAKAKEIQIELDDQLLDTAIVADREQLCRALTNLLLNAVQASGEKTSIQLIARREKDSNGSVCLDVLDDGPGLTPEIEDNLFKPFFTTKPSGTGLGLANVKKIMDLHEGAVSATNRPGGGAVFTLELPGRGEA
jgi:signal transduction histidine kinase